MSLEKPAAPSSPQILLFNKPRNLVVTTSDELARRTIYDVLPEWVRADGWVPAGRLDKESTGLLFLVKDRSLVHHLTQPGVISKYYDVVVRGRVLPQHLRALKTGVPNAAGVLKCEDVSIKGIYGPKTRLLITLREGKNRHIRRMLGALRDEKMNTPLKVLDLTRIQIGPIRLDVAPGEFRFLTPTEACSLLEMAGITEP